MYDQNISSKKFSIKHQIFKIKRKSYSKILFTSNKMDIGSLWQFDNFSEMLLGV